MRQEEQTFGEQDRLFILQFSQVKGQHLESSCGGEMQLESSLLGIFAENTGGNECESGENKGKTGNLKRQWRKTGQASTRGVDQSQGSVGPENGSF